MKFPQCNSPEPVEANRPIEYRWAEVMKVRDALDKLGFALCMLALAVCLILHVGSFVGIVSLMWLIPPFFILAGAILCARAVEPRLRLPLRMDKVSVVGFGLLVYAILLFVYFYKTTGGPSSVAVVNGQYVSKSKDHVIRTITEQEYRNVSESVDSSDELVDGNDGCLLLQVFHVSSMAQAHGYHEWVERE